jgi:hypothetical protein
MVPSVGPQVRELSHEAQRAIGDLRHNATVRRHDDRYHISEKIQAQLRGLPSRLGQAAAPLRDVTVGVFGFASNLVAVMSIAFLLILHGGRYAGAVVYQAVSAYVVGNLEISVIAGAGAWVTMTVLGVPFAVPLAIVVGFFDLIPMVGATLGAIVVALAALLVSPLTAVIWLVYVFVYQQAENYLIQPVVYRRAVQVAPLTTIVAVLVGSTLLGLLGALLAIPAAAAVQLSVQDLRADRARLGVDSAA